MEIRKSVPEDSKFISSLDRENMKTIVEENEGEYYPYWFGDFNPGKCFILEEKEPIGFLYIHNPGDKLNIINIQIKNSYQGQSYGKELLKKAIQIAKKDNLKKIFLETYNNNKKAQKFYKKQGFREIGKTSKNKTGFELEL